MSFMSLTRPGLTKTRLLAMAALGLAMLSPGLAMAQSACDHSQTISCPDGHSYDAETQSCTPPPTS